MRKKNITNDTDTHEYKEMQSGRENENYFNSFTGGCTTFFFADFLLGCPALSVHRSGYLMEEGTFKILLAYKLSVYVSNMN